MLHGDSSAAASTNAACAPADCSVESVESAISRAACHEASALWFPSELSARLRSRAIRSARASNRIKPTSRAAFTYSEPGYRAAASRRTPSDDSGFAPSSARRTSCATNAGSSGANSPNQAAPEAIACGSARRSARRSARSRSAWSSGSRRSAESRYAEAAPVSSRRVALTVAASLHRRAAIGNRSSSGTEQLRGSAGGSVSSRAAIATVERTRACQRSC